MHPDDIRYPNGRARYHKAWVPGRGVIDEHRLVMEAKLGRELRSDEHVHHLNGNPRDNRPENLQLLSQAEHNREHDTLGRWYREHPERILRGDQHPKRVHPETAARGERAGGAKLTATQVVEIRARNPRRGQYSALAREYGVTDVMIRNIVLRKSWRHL